MTPPMLNLHGRWPELRAILHAMGDRAECARLALDTGLEGEDRDRERDAYVAAVAAEAIGYNLFASLDWELRGPVAWDEQNRYMDIVDARMSRWAGEEDWAEAKAHARFVYLHGGTLLPEDEQ